MGLILKRGLISELIRYWSPSPGYDDQPHLQPYDPAHIPYGNPQWVGGDFGHYERQSWGSYSDIEEEEEIRPVKKLMTKEVPAVPFPSLFSKTDGVKAPGNSVAPVAFGNVGHGTDDEYTQFWKHWPWHK